MNPSTKGVILWAITGASYWGLKKLKEVKQGKMEDGEVPVEQKKEFSGYKLASTMLTTTSCATAAGWFQVYSGGIAIDTVATRLQAGISPTQSLWGTGLSTTNVSTLVARYGKANGVSPLHARYKLLMRSNLAAGHFVTMLSRFPYLFLNFSSYDLADRYIQNRYEQADSLTLHRKSLFEEFICVLTATLVSTTAITAAECPKILDQVAKGDVVCKQGRATVLGVIRTQGIRRLMQGYSACFCRELMFNTALLGSPSLAVYIREHYVLPNLETSSFARFVDTNEILLASILLSTPIGFLTNGPDQIKTNIQKGQFKNMREALQWQMKNGGIRALYGRAAWYRMVYIIHAVVAFNFARAKVESWIGNE